MAYADLNEAVLSQVRAAADIVDIVGQVTPLKPAGKSYKGLCPFHREKTPSFQVDRDKGLFYCFGCQKGGDVFTFLMMAERFTFPEAVEHVAARVGIQLPRRKDRDRESGKDELLEILDEASAAYHQALQWTPNPAVDYLKGRNVDPESWRKYGFGYAPDSWDYVLSRLGRKHTTEKLEAAGLVLPRKSGTGHYDRFRNRLMVPIHSEAGNVIGFGGRSLDGSDPKYLNSPETAIFNKSHLLYNLHRAKDQIRKLERAILVEGYFDCIALDSVGVPGVVASMGTSLTPGQASLLRRFAKRVIIAYDGDEAGRNATLRAAPIFLVAGINVDVIDVGPGEDPDTFIRKFGVETVMERLANAVDIFQYSLNRWAASAATMTSREKSALLELFLPLLSSVTDPVIRNDAAQRVADRLRLEFETVWSRLKVGRGDPGRVTVVPEAVSTGERQLLRAVLREDFPKPLLGQIREEFFQDDTCRGIFQAIQKIGFNDQPLDFSAIATHLRGEAELTRLSELALSDETEGLNPKKLEETIRLMERRFLDRRLKEIQAEIQEAMGAGDHDRVQTLDQEKIQLSRRLHLK